MMEACLYCHHGAYDGGDRVICYLYDKLVMMNDKCELFNKRE